MSKLIQVAEACPSLELVILNEKRKSVGKKALDIEDIIPIVAYILFKEYDKEKNIFKDYTREQKVEFGDELSSLSISKHVDTINNMNVNLGLFRIFDYTEPHLQEEYIEQCMSGVPKKLRVIAAVAIDPNIVPNKRLKAVFWDNSRGFGKG